MAAQQRPLSPHLTVYKLPLAARLSILHRATGCFLAVAAFGLALWLVAAAGSPDDYARFVELARSWPAQLLMLAALFCFFLHLCTGIRHLLWDIGLGLGLKSVLASNWAVVLLSLAGAAAYGWLAWNAGGWA
jgi:succinate dehydrogenase / fumarate reductase cytochrome b subunit